MWTFVNVDVHIKWSLHTMVCNNIFPYFIHGKKNIISKVKLKRKCKKKKKEKKNPLVLIVGLMTLTFHEDHTQGK